MSFFRRVVLGLTFVDVVLNNISLVCLAFRLSALNVGFGTTAHRFNSVTFFWVRGTVNRKWGHWLIKNSGILAGTRASSR